MMSKSDQDYIDHWNSLSHQDRLDYGNVIEKKYNERLLRYYCI
jgi:hypothetical protein